MHFLPAKGRVMYFRKLSRVAGVSEAGARRRNPERQREGAPDAFVDVLARFEPIYGQERGRKQENCQNCHDCRNRSVERSFQFRRFSKLSFRAAINGSGADSSPFGFGMTLFQFRRLWQSWQLAWS